MSMKLFLERWHWGGKHTLTVVSGGSGGTGPQVQTAPTLTLCFLVAMGWAMWLCSKSPSTHREVVPYHRCRTGGTQWTHPWNHAITPPPPCFPGVSVTAVKTDMAIQAHTGLPLLHPLFLNFWYFSVRINSISPRCRGHVSFKRWRHL